MMKSSWWFALRKALRYAAALTATALVVTGLIFGGIAWQKDQRIRNHDIVEGMHKDDVLRHLGRPEDIRKDRHSNAIIWTYYPLSWDAVHFHLDAQDRVEHIGYY